MGIIIKMGMKFYRGADKPKKIRKRFTQSRSWFRTFKWTCYHAHPLNIIGHEFKGGMYLSTGYLAHPDMKRFALDDATLFTLQELMPGPKIKSLEPQPLLFLHLVIS